MMSDVIHGTNEYLESTVNPSTSFSKYITSCRSLISSRRIDLNHNPKKNVIIDANSPFALYPNEIPSSKKFKYGALLIHGLFDCPFSLKEIALQLQSQQIPSKAILLPGHGTVPSDLLSVNFNEWIKTVEYGVDLLRQEAEKVILIGYSTGAALSIYQALTSDKVAGMVLLSPAIKIKINIELIKAYQQMKGWFDKDEGWILKTSEDDYAKYRSLTYNSVYQVDQLTKEVAKLSQKNTLSTPLLMILSEQDETISSPSAIEFFSNIDHKKNKLILYTSHLKFNKDPRIILRQSRNSALNIHDFSHVSIPFSAHNPHYGWDGDFPHAPSLKKQDHIYGSYTRIEIETSDWLYKCRLTKYLQRSLTFNPDFKFMMKNIQDFIIGV